jgi:hypothetical protein
MVGADQRRVSLLLVRVGELSLVSDKERDSVVGCVTQFSRQCRSGFERRCCLQVWSEFGREASW